MASRIACGPRRKAGSGIIVYNRNEGRALGEVVKYLVYNARPRAAEGDTEDQYFAHTEAVAGVQDLRQQTADRRCAALAGRQPRRPLAVDEQHEARRADRIRHRGRRQIELPDHLVDHAARIEFGAKKTAGYFSERKAG